MACKSLISSTFSTFIEVEIIKKSSGKISENAIFEIVATYFYPKQYMNIASLVEYGGNIRKSDRTLRKHRGGDLNKSGNISSCNEIITESVVVGSLDGGIEYILHYTLELLVNLLCSPGKAHRVLSHLKT